jgi:hypothetical protein
MHFALTRIVSDSYTVHMRNRQADYLIIPIPPFSVILVALFLYLLLPLVVLFIFWSHLN